MKGDLPPHPQTRGLYVGEVRRLPLIKGQLCEVGRHRPVAGQPNRNELTFDEWMELDLRYIRDRSFWVDWKLIFQTVGVVFRMYGV